LHHNNKQQDGLVKPKYLFLCLVIALGLKDNVGSIYFYPHMIFPGGSVTPESHRPVAIGNPERHVRKALHCGSKQQ